MNEPTVEQQLGALEAAMELSQTKNLPVVIPAHSPIIDPRYAPESQDMVRRSSELAFNLLRKVEARIADIEDERVEDRQKIYQQEAVQGEHAEAIELISKEVANLRKRAAKLEKRLRKAAAPSGPAYYPDPTRARLQISPTLLFLLFAGIFIVVAFLVSAIVH